MLVLERNKIVFGLGGPNPTGGADGATSDPLVDWDRVRYTVPVFLPLIGRTLGGSIMGFGVRKSQ